MRPIQNTRGIRPDLDHGQDTTAHLWRDENNIPHPIIPYREDSPRRVEAGDRFVGPIAAPVEAVVQARRHRRRLAEFILDGEPEERRRGGPLCPEYLFTNPE